MTLAAGPDLALPRLAMDAWLPTVGVSVAALAVRVISGAPPLPNRFSLGDAAAAAIGLRQVVTATIPVSIGLWLRPREGRR